MHRKRCLGWLCLMSFLALASPASAQPPALSLSVYPFFPASEIIKRFEPLAQYLEGVLGRPVSVQVASSYSEQTTIVGEDRADLAYMGPVLYVRAVNRYGPKPLLARLQDRGVESYRGIIIVREDSPIRTLPDLKGRTFAFSDKSSTMGYVVPRALLMASGIDLANFSSCAFLKGHEDVALGVIGGYFDAGAIRDDTFEKYRQRGLRKVAETGLVPEHVFVAGGRLEPALVEQVRRALLDIARLGKADPILTSIKASATGLVPAADSDYAELARMVRDVDRWDAR